jgi:hypothetical protein
VGIEWTPARRVDRLGKIGESVDILTKKGERVGQKKKSREKRRKIDNRGSKTRMNFGEEVDPGWAQQMT